MKHEVTLPHRRSLHILYFAIFAAALNATLPAFVNSSFLGEVIREQWIGIVYAAASLLAILFLFFVPRILASIGNYRLGALATLVQGSVTILIAYAISPLAIIPAFIAMNAVSKIASFSLDVGLERYSSNAHTGDVRGIFLSLVNGAWILSPLVAGVLVAAGNFRVVYLLAGAVMFLVLPALFAIRRTHDVPYRHPPIITTLRNMWRHRDLMRVFAARTMLFFFFSWMVIYVPLFLARTVGFEWDRIGIILSIALIPYILLEYPLGHLADTRFGEKEIMTAGFILIGLFTLPLGFIASSSFFFWALLLFATRIGASMVEAMTETYFFKKIDAASSDFLSIFRMAEPLAYVIAPLIASLLLIVVPMHYLFVVLGIIMVAGVTLTLPLTDTR